MKFVRSRHVLPGFGLTLGITLTYLSLIVLIPLSMILLRSTELSFGQFWEIVTSSRALASYRLSLICSAIGAAINTVFGLLVAWMLVRYRFPGRRIVDGLVDLPFALPTAVSGIALTALYAPTGWLGAPLNALGIQGAYSALGVTIALTFIGLPFVVRTVQPVLADLDPEIEEAASTLGARRRQTFLKVILPELTPALVTGFALAFARGLGEYGSVIFIAGNMPGKTEILPLLIMIKLEQYDYAGATALALVFLIMSFGVLFALNLVQRRAQRLGWQM